MGTIIEIKETKYPVKYGYGAFRILGIQWDCKGINGVAKKFSEIFPEGGSDEVSFEQADLLGDLALAGIEAGGTVELPERDDVVQELLFNPKKIEVIMTAFSESFPQPGNAEPRSKARKTAIRKK